MTDEQPVCPHRIEAAEEIRRELVCCRIYDRVNDTGELTFEEAMGSLDWHDLCYWGEAAARLAEGRPDRKGSEVPKGVPLDLTGRVFSRWTVLERHDVTASGEVRWWCRCECSRVVAVQANNLVTGKSTQCRRCAIQRMTK